MSTLTPSHARTELIRQHTELRRQMDLCLELADDLDAGLCDAAHLMREVTKLRLAFDAHNQFEEALLRPVLLEADAFGDVRIDRMEAEHISEHRSLGSGLASEITTQLRETIEALRAHLVKEERYFLSAKVLRDDLVSVEGSS